MCSKADLQAATDFIAQHRIAPVVSRVPDRLENDEEGFELIARGEHFGKIVIRMDGRLLLYAQFIVSLLGGAYAVIG
jgi:D-arabinose 1-dehydrogenase-like Zn-dependent alcohol dehydrogenase